jgi:hypothetical protein
MLAKKTLVVLAVVLLWPGMGAEVRGAEPEPATILTTRGFWRVRVWPGPIPILLKDGTVEPKLPQFDNSDGWMKTEFDDSSWVRTPGPLFSSSTGGWKGWSGDEPETALIRIRGRFAVTDPAAVESLKLGLTYRGGVVVYLNGHEIGRGDMPEGKIASSTLAKPYPDKAFVVPDGRRVISGGYGEPAKYKDRLMLRRRTLGVDIDTKWLRKGTNVLAIDLHRTGYNEVATYKDRNGKRRLKGGRGVRAYNDIWSTAALMGVGLSATGGGIRPNVTRSKGFQVWNGEPLLLTYDTDYGDAGVEPDPVQIVGARNGRFSGILIAGYDQPIEGLKATVTELKAETGDARIAAEAVEIRYQLPGDVDPAAATRVPGGRHFRTETNVRRMEALAPEPPEKIAVQKKNLVGKQNVVFGAVCPIWLTVHVPKDAAAGLYTGTCRIEAKGVEAVEVPVRVRVSDWTLPPPYEFRTVAGFHQSPETLALHYKVPLWSDAHFKLIDDAFKWLGSVGCKTIHLHLVERTNMGNAWSIVRWKRKKDAPEPKPVKKGELPKVTPETHEPDFTVADRYLDIALKHLVKPPVVNLYAWDNYCGTMYHGAANSRHNVPPKPACVTEMVDGKARHAQAANYKNIDEAVAFWKPVAEHYQAYLKKRDLEKSLFIGISHDSWPADFVVKTWQKLLPDAPWAFQGHPRPGEMYGVPINYVCTVWGCSPRPPRGLKHAWQIPKLECHFDRYTRGVNSQSELLDKSFLAGEVNITTGQRGFGRRAADLWPVIPAGRGRLRSLSARYPENGWGACNLRQRSYLAPGKDGPISTGRLEMMREGLQECEARIFIEEAFLSAENRAECGADFVKRCEAALAARPRSGNGALGAVRFIGSGRKERTRLLYDLAGQVAAALNK